MNRKHFDVSDILEKFLESQADRIADSVLERFDCVRHPRCFEIQQRHDACSGVPLPRLLRQQLELLFGASLTEVRIHTDEHAQSWCRRLGARAFTVGDDIFFAANRFAPGTREGIHLLAHELTHVLQQAWLRHKFPPRLAEQFALQRKVEFLQGTEPKPEEILDKVKLHIKHDRFPLSRKGGIAANYMRKAFAAQDDNTQVERISTAIKRMHEAVEDYGLINMEDEQQRGYFLAALCDLIIRPERHPTKKQMPDVGRKTFSLALIGRGSSIGYYLNSLPKTYDHSKSVIVGEQDPWHGENLDGRGKGDINHQRQMIIYYGEQVPAHHIEYFDRNTFASETLRVIEAAKINTSIEDSVTSIEFDSQADAYKISCKTANPFYARKVVVGMGAGPHRDPEKVLGIRKEEDKEKGKERSIMNLDEFMRFSFEHLKSGKLENKRIVIHGHNAGIDAVERAGNCNMKDANIEWLVGKETPPALLTGNHLVHAKRLAKKTIPVAREGFSFVKSNGRLTITYDDFSSKPRKFENIDYYVYALGQNVNAKGAAGDILSEDIKEKLKPLYDINLRLGDNPYETVLALECRLGKDSNRRLQIIGAAAFSMAKAARVRHSLRAIANTKQFIQDLQPKLEQSNSDMATRARRFFDRYIAESGQYSLLNDQKNAKDTDYLEIAKWVNEQNEARSKFVLDRIEGNTVNTAEYKALLERMLPWDSWVRQVNLLTDMTQKSTETNIQNQMNNQAKTLPPSVIVAPQLSAIRTAMMALNATMPPFITRSADLIGNDRTQFQVHLMTRILEGNIEEKISPAMAAMLVEDFVAYRSKLEDYPYGLDSTHAVKVFNPIPDLAG